MPKLTGSTSHKQTGHSWGWVVVVASTIVMLGFYGTSGSFGVFLKPIVEMLDSTRVIASSAMSTFMGVTGFVGIFAGRLTDKYGARVIIGAGAILGCLGYLLMYQASSLWQLHFYFGVMAGAAMGTCFTPIIATVSKWFTEKRVLAVGLTTIGIAVGQMILPPLVAYFIAEYGWRLAYVIMAIVVIITAIPAVALLGRKPPQNADISRSGKDTKASVNAVIELPGQSKEWSVRRAIVTLPFWMFVIVGFVTATGFYIMLVHIVAYMTDVGITITSVALMLTFMNVGGIAAQLLVWFLTRRIGSRFSIVILQGLQALALFLLMGATSFNMFIALGLVFGIGFGGSNTVRLSMISDVFGTRSSGAILGLISVAWSAGGIFGPILAGYIFDKSQSYDMAFLIGGLLLTAGAVSGFFLKAPEY